MKTIGILGGLGPESTVSYYTHITRRYYDLRGDYAYPNIVVYSMSFRPIIEAGYDAPDDVLDALRCLHSAGADFVVAACNSIHLVYDQVAPQSPIPWVSIMDATAESVTANNLDRVGLLGTRLTMSKGFYQRALARHGVEAIVPEEDAQDEINRIIFDELVRNDVREDSRTFVQGCIETLQKRGAEGIVLGCTELPFLIRPQDSPLPVFDTAEIHASKALDLAME